MFPVRLEALLEVDVACAPSAGSSRSSTALRKGAGLCCGSRLRKGEVFAYVGLPKNLKDLKDMVLLLGPMGWRGSPAGVVGLEFERLGSEGI